MNQVARTSTPKVVLTIVDGPHKGSQFKVNSSKITIGRSRDNDIPLEKDPKVSRMHVQIDLSPTEIIATSLSDGNPMYIDSNLETSISMMPGSLIQVGESVIRLEIRNTELTPQQEEIPRNIIQQQGPLTMQPYSNRSAQDYSFYGSSKKSNRQSEEAKKKKRFYIIVGTVFALFALLMLTNNKKNIPPEELLDEKEVSNRIETTINNTKKQRDLLIQSGKTVPHFKFAQESYIKGFRDFERGNYERSIQAFQACLSLFPSHTLCNRYLNLAQRKHQELIHYYMVRGAKHLKTNQFRPCLNAFRNVMIMVKVKSNALYKEASANFKYCQIRMEGHY